MFNVIKATLDKTWMTENGYEAADLSKEIYELGVEAIELKKSYCTVTCDNLEQLLKIYRKFSKRELDSAYQQLNEESEFNIILEELRFDENIWMFLEKVHVNELKQASDKYLVNYQTFEETKGIIVVIITPKDNNVRKYESCLLMNEFLKSLHDKTVNSVTSDIFKVQSSLTQRIIDDLNVQFPQVVIKLVQNKNCVEIVGMPMDCQKAKTYIKTKYAPRLIPKLKNTNNLLPLKKPVQNDDNVNAPPSYVTWMDKMSKVTHYGQNQDYQEEGSGELNDVYLDDNNAMIAHEAGHNKNITTGLDNEEVNYELSNTNLNKILPSFKSQISDKQRVYFQRLNNGKGKQNLKLDDYTEKVELGFSGIATYGNDKNYNDNINGSNHKDDDDDDDDDDGYKDSIQKYHQGEGNDIGNHNILIGDDDNDNENIASTHDVINNNNIEDNKDAMNDDSIDIQLQNEEEYDAKYHGDDDVIQNYQKMSENFNIHDFKVSENVYNKEAENEYLKEVKNVPEVEELKDNVTTQEENVNEEIHADEKVQNIPKIGANCIEYTSDPFKIKPSTFTPTPTISIKPRPKQKSKFTLRKQKLPSGPGDSFYDDKPAENLKEEGNIVEDDVSGLKNVALKLPYQSDSDEDD